MTETELLTVKIPVAIKRKLKEEAERLNISMGAIIKTILDDHLRQRERG